MFKQAGVEAPTNDWTWTDLQKAAKKISSKTDAKGFSFQMKPDPYDFEMYLWSNDTAYSDENGTLEGNIDSAKAIDTYQMFQDMEKDGSAVATEGNGTDEFRAGTTAMYIYGSWALSTLDEDGLNYGVVDIPAFADSDHDSVSILSSSGISIAKSSKNKDAAWEFIKYWANADSNKARIGSELPVLTSVVESEASLTRASTSRSTRCWNSPTATALPASRSRDGPRSPTSLPSPSRRCTTPPPSKIPLRPSTEALK